MKYLHDLWSFTYHQAMSCIFPVVIFGTLAISNFLPSVWVPRYDFILLVCVGMQMLLLKTRIETFDEFKVIGLFHVIGLALELYKVHMGSWSYPEEAWTKVAGVPLYSGFMYASVASYMCQAWRRLNLQLNFWPNSTMVCIVAIAVYANFFTHHFVYDFRWLLMLVVIVLFWKTTVSFSINNKLFQMPLVLSFALIGFFIWVAENIATFFGAWQYPDQKEVWAIVSFGKISSWLLLVIVSFLIVSTLKHVKSSKKFSNGYTTTKNG